MVTPLQPQEIEMTEMEEFEVSIVKILAAIKWKRVDSFTPKEGKKPKMELDITRGDEKIQAKHQTQI